MYKSGISFSDDYLHYLRIIFYPACTDCERYAWEKVKDRELRESPPVSPDVSSLEQKKQKDKKLKEANPK